jgi:hypothetical protein
VLRALRSRHALPALAAVVAALAAPGLAADDDVSASATNVVTQAAQEGLADERPGAEQFPLDSAAFQTAQRIATEHWGGAPACGGEVRFSWQAMDPGTNATASWRNPTDAWNNPAENFDCAIDLNTNAGYDLPKLCTVLAHELGHLLGNPHADQPGLLMSPVYSDALPACAGTAPAPAPAPVQVAPAPAPASSTQPATRTRIVKKTVRTTTVTRAAKRTAARKTLRRARTRCVRVLKAGKRTKRCTRVARRASAPASRARR